MRRTRVAPGRPVPSLTHWGRAMQQDSAVFVGLDTSKMKISVALAEEGRHGEVRFLGDVDHTPEAVRRLVGKLAGKYGRLLFCYEAGPTGYGLQRQISALGHDCAVIAPSLIPKRPGERVKTNRRDAITLARLHRAGELTRIWVPDPGVTSPFAQNCTLSGAGQERGGNIPEWPQAVGRLSRVPIVLARERDVLPAERRDVGEQFVGDDDALGADVLDGTVEIGRVPVDDGGRQQAQPRSPEALVLERAVAELALAVEEHGPAERIDRLPLVQPGMAALAECRVRQPLQGEQGPFDAPQRP